jgi:hypothetical protein
MARTKFSDISRATPEQRVAARSWAREEVAKMKLRDLRLSTCQSGAEPLEIEAFGQIGDDERADENP